MRSRAPHAAAAYCSTISISVGFATTSTSSRHRSSVLPYPCIKNRKGARRHVSRATEAPAQVPRTGRVTLLSRRLGRGNGVSPCIPGVSHTRSILVGVCAP